MRRKHCGTTRGTPNSRASPTVAVVPDPVPSSVRASLDDPFAALTGSLAEARRLSFEVVGAPRISPSFVCMTLTAPELDGFRYLPGQDVMLLVGADGTRPIRRRYTIRSFDPAALRLELHVVLHGDGPGERWVSAAAPGDTIEGIGPRGKITTRPDADWHLFIGDDSALPAYLAMAGAVPAGARALVILEVAGRPTVPVQPGDLRVGGGDQVLLARGAGHLQDHQGPGAGGQRPRHRQVGGQRRVVPDEQVPVRRLRQEDLPARPDALDPVPGPGRGDPALPRPAGVADHVDGEQPPLAVERADRVAAAHRAVAVHRHHEHHVLAGLVLQPGQLGRGQHQALHAGAERRGVDHLQLHPGRRGERPGQQSERVVQGGRGVGHGR